MTTHVLWHYTAAWNVPGIMAEGMRTYQVADQWRQPLGPLLAHLGGAAVMTYRNRQQGLARAGVAWWHMTTKGDPQVAELRLEVPEAWCVGWGTGEGKLLGAPAPLAWNIHHGGTFGHTGLPTVEYHDKEPVMLVRRRVPPARMLHVDTIDAVAAVQQLIAARNQQPAAVYA